MKISICIDLSIRNSRINLQRINIDVFLINHSQNVEKNKALSVWDEKEKKNSLSWKKNEGRYIHQLDYPTWV